jgi:hypothetical protein
MVFGIFVLLIIAQSLIGTAHYYNQIVGATTKYL